MRKKKEPNLGRLKKTIMFVEIGHLSYEQWVRYRKEYIGGSDVSTLLGLNPYQSKLELFHEKVGVVNKVGKETEATYSGHVLEDHIINKYWIYHDNENPTPENLIANAVAKKPKRYARRIKDKMMYDPRFPHLKINLDGLIQKTRFEKTPKGILEIKSGLGRVWNTYEAGIPVFYIIQVQTYLLVTGLKYAEIGVLLDGRYFKCFPILANAEIQKRIIDETTEFWDLVQEGGIIWEDTYMTEAEKIQALSVIEPGYDGSAALDTYLKERFRSDYKAGQLLITDEIITFAKLYLATNNKSKLADEEKRSYSNALKKIFLDNKVDEIIDDKSRVLISNRSSGKGKSPVLRVSKKMMNYLD